MGILRLRFTVCCALTLLVAGCATSTAPRGWLPDVAEVSVNATGGWVSVVSSRHRSERRTDGELIAVDPESLFVLSDGALVALPRRPIASAKVMLYDMHAGKLAGWTTFGTVMTLSHGFVLIITAPLWIITGSIATSSASRAPQLSYPRVPWERLAEQARFPQGLPPGLDRSSLQTR